MRNEEAVRIVWLLYSPPVEHESRTGHVGLLVTQEVDATIKALYYFSLYHALLPDDVRAMGWGDRFSKRIPATVVSSYEDDVVMRGQSWTRMKDERIRENEKSQDLIATLPTDPQLREKYFNRGVYKYAVRLPQSIDVDAVIVEAERIKNVVWWAMVGPVTRSLFLDPTAYNCCSAIDSILEKGMQKPYQEGRVGDLIEVSKITLTTLYLMTILFSPDVSLSRDNPATVLWFVPAIYLVVRALQNAFEHIFMNDLKLTPLGKLEKHEAYLYGAFFSVLNLLAMPFASRATNAFIYPTSLANKAVKEYGGMLSHAGFVDLPRFSSH